MLLLPFSPASGKVLISIADCGTRQPCYRPGIIHPAFFNVRTEALRQTGTTLSLEELSNG